MYKRKSQSALGHRIYVYKYIQPFGFRFNWNNIFTILHMQYPKKCFTTLVRTKKASKTAWPPKKNGPETWLTAVLSQARSDWRSHSSKPRLSVDRCVWLNKWQHYMSCVCFSPWSCMYQIIEHGNEIGQWNAQFLDTFKGINLLIVSLVLDQYSDPNKREIKKVSVWHCWTIRSCRVPNEWWMHHVGAPAGFFW